MNTVTRINMAKTEKQIARANLKNYKYVMAMRKLSDVERQILRSQFGWFGCYKILSIRFAQLKTFKDIDDAAKNLNCNIFKFEYYTITYNSKKKTIKVFVYGTKYKKDQDIISTIKERAREKMIREQNRANTLRKKYNCNTTDEAKALIRSLKKEFKL